ncbi:MAG: septal ring lytic transglycosylase RlpA family protein [Rhodospirillales bacterium]
MISRWLLTPTVVFGLAGTLAACGSTAPQTAAPVTTAQPGSGLYKVGKPYQIKGIWYYPQIDYDYVEEGVASWYGPGFHGKATANGETYDQNDMTAAHRTLPLPSIVRVTNLENGRSIKLRVNDRGPFAQSRIIDLSRRAAQLLGIYNAGTAPVRVEIDAEESRQLAIALTGTDYPDGSGGTLVAKRQSSPPPAYPVAFREPPPEEAPIVAPLPTTPAFAESALAEPEPIVAATEAPEGIVGAVPEALPADPAASFATGEPPPLPPLALPPLHASTPGPVASFSPAPPPSVPAHKPASPPVIGEVRFPNPTGGHAADGRAYVQAGAFSQLANVQKARVQLARLGPVHVTNIGSPGRDLWRVRLGPLPSPDEAERLVGTVLRSGYPGSHVVVE